MSFDAPIDTEQPSLSYERDVMPLKRQFFSSLLSNPKMSGYVRNKLAMANSDALDQSFATQKKLSTVDEEQERKSRKLQYEASLLNLQTARDKAAREREQINSFLPFQQELDAIVSNPELGSDEKTHLVGRHGMKYGNLLAFNEAASQAFSAARLALTPSKQDAITGYDYWRDGGDPDFIEEYGRSIGRPIEATTPIPPDVAMRGKQQAIARQNALKQQLAAEKEAKDTRDGAVNAVLANAGKASLLADEYSTQDKFKGTSDEANISNLVSLLGTPEENAALAKTTSPSEKLKISAAVQKRHYDSMRGTQAGSSPRDLFHK
jgi:hypothetical protein